MNMVQQGLEGNTTGSRVGSFKCCHCHHPWDCF